MRLTRPTKMRAAALVLAAAVLLPLPARATVGGDTKVEVLGYARVDRKMYWLEVFEGERPAHAAVVRAHRRSDTTTWPGESELGFVDHPQHTVRCELTHDAASAVGRPVTVTVFEDPEVRIASAFAVPGGDAGIVVLRYLGDPYETGYAIELGVPVLPE